MRLFVAFSISSDVREHLASLIEDLRRADQGPRWVNPTNLHITLKFIGEVPAEKRAPIEQALAAVLTPAPMNLEFRGIGFFPNDRRPSVVWAGIEAAGLATFAGRIDQALTSCGIPRETRPFAPHLTLARFKDARLSAALRAQTEKYKEHSFGNQSAQEFHLVESKLKSGGAEYTTLRSFSFSPRA